MSVEVTQKAWIDYECLGTTCSHVGSNTLSVYKDLSYRFNSQRVALQLSQEKADYETAKERAAKWKAATHLQMQSNEHDAQVEGILSKTPYKIGVYLGGYHLKRFLYVDEKGNFWLKYNHYWYKYPEDTG